MNHLMSKTKTVLAHDAIAEKMKIYFALMLRDLLLEKGLSQVDLAKRIGKSKAFVSKVMRGDANLTIETMAMLVCAVDEEPVITIKRTMAVGPKQVVGQTVAERTQAKPATV